MDEQSQQRRFFEEEVGELIETATRLDQLRHEGPGLGEEELRQVAAELGVSEAALQRALDQRAEQEAAHRAARQARQEAQAAEAAAEAKRVRKRQKAINDWKSHAASYVGVIGGLAAIDWFSETGFDWFFFPAAGWGIGFLIHTFNVLLRVED